MSRLLDLGIRSLIRVASDNPASGQRLLYPKSDGWYDRDSSGTETKVQPTGTKVSALSAASAANTGMEIPTNDGGTSRKVTIAQIQDLLGRVKGRVSSDHAISATTATACTLSTTPTLGVGTWAFQLNVIVQTATVTVSPKIGINHTGTVGTLLAMARMIDISAAGAAAVQALAGASTAGTPTQVSGMQVTALSTTAPNIQNTAGTNPLSATATNALWVIEGIMVVTASGNFELWHGSETATSTTVKADSTYEFAKVA